jgi:TonB family protein
MHKLLLVRTCFAAVLVISFASASLSEEPWAPKSPVNTESPAMLNNDGVKALNARNFRVAIDKFRQALKKNPAYEYARDNLAIGYNNYALTQEPKEAQSFFHKALLLGPNNTSTRDNLNVVFKDLKKGVFNRAEDRVRFGDELLAKKDFVGAYVEYSEALRLKQDASIKAKLASVPKVDELFAVADAAPKGAPMTYRGGDVDFGPYMAALQREIKKNWFPPKGDESKRVSVIFKIDKTGGLSALHLDKSSGIPMADTAALHAVSSAAPFADLPKNSPAVVDIMFTFDYNVFTGSRSVSKTTDANQKEGLRLIGQAKPLIQKGDHKQAFALLEKAVRIDSLSDEARNLEISEGIILAKQAGSPDGVLDALCDLLETTGASNSYKQPLSDAIKALGKNPDSFNDVRGLSGEARKREKWNTETVLLNTALALAPTDQEKILVRDEIGSIYKRKNAESLIKRWQWALDQRKSAENYAGLGSAYEMRGDNDKAQELYEKAIEIDPYHENAKALLVSLKERMNAKPVKADEPTGKTEAGF